MLYLDCQHDPVRLTEHLRGTRESEPKKKRKVCLVGVWEHGTCQKMAQETTSRQAPISNGHATLGKGLTCSPPKKVPGEPDQTYRSINKILAQPRE